MTVTRSLIAPTANPLLERALRDKLQRRSETTGSLGELEPLAVRMGLMQNTLKPRFADPQMLLFAADHGLAVEASAAHSARPPSWYARLLTGQLPVSVFARIQGLGLTVVDAGVAENLPPHPRLMVRKIAHGTRNAASVRRCRSSRRTPRSAPAWRSPTLCRATCSPAPASASARTKARRWSCRGWRTRRCASCCLSGPSMKQDELAQLLVVAQGAQGRHRDVADPVEVLAAFGGFEIAMMVGVMLVAASKRHLVMVDGMPACAALMVAARIAAPVTDYCVFCRSHGHHGLDIALNLFRASALLELGMEGTDGTGATLAWPLVKSAAALLTEVAEGEDPGPSRPSEIDA